MIELIVVLAILAILAVIAIPSVTGYIDTTKEQVCKTNCLKLERIYESYLILEDLEHTDAIFHQYKLEYGQDICPEHGELSYINGKIQCKIHNRGDATENYDDDGSVPFL